MDQTPLNPIGGGSQSTTKTKTRTHVLVGVLLILLGVGVVFAVLASRIPALRNRLTFSSRVVTPVRPVTPAPEVEVPAAPLHTPAVGTSEGLCDDLDNDNDGATDDGCDADNDNYCPSVVPGATSATCTAGGGDCVDGNPAIGPGVPENCENLYDDNCNNLVGEGCR